MKVRVLSTGHVRRIDFLGLETIPTDRTAKLYLQQGRHNAFIVAPEGTDGNSVPTFFLKSDYIALVQHFLRTYFPASHARCAPSISRDPVVDAD